MERLTRKELQKLSGRKVLVGGHDDHDWTGTIVGMDDYGSVLVGFNSVDQNVPEGWDLDDETESLFDPVFEMTFEKGWWVAVKYLTLVEQEEETPPSNGLSFRQVTTLLKLARELLSANAGGGDVNEIERAADRLWNYVLDENAATFLA